ncbi:hypothetical protein QBC34DRAFT_303301 [Podospora aff. communis PSN243]|uniref:C2H2-type domain-containing protein n=1 Tax=Podospora aff. communis PSN243 TaxID=3040156 RepID=A0AAV9GGZ6_9PEZI|nr:hypothetical protein QBC34DRAFT_303301 [Podospora aff. communis PSN243]
MSITLEWLSREPVPGTFNLITDEAIDAASSQPTPSTHGRGAEGSGNGEDGDDIHAIGTLLSACLRAHSDADDPLRAAAVQQAACQIILRLPEEDSSYTLCWSTLKTALENAGASLAREKTPHPCKEPGCQKAFSRGADLQRHAKIIHQPESDRKQYVCDYKRCPRHKSPFFRMDHFKDHLRDDHKEDLTRRGVKPDEKWWAGRSRTSTEKGWFRCSKCLVQRVDVEEYGYTCPGCGHTCEADRQKYRKRLGQELPAGW